MDGKAWTLAPRPHSFIVKSDLGLSQLKYQSGNPTMPINNAFKHCKRHVTRLTPTVTEGLIRHPSQASFDNIDLTTGNL